MSEAPPAETAAPVAPTTQRTAAQLEALNRARVKAAEVRQQNKALRDKQKEIERAAVEKTKKEHSERVQREYDALKQEKEEESRQEEEEVEEVVQKKPRKKKRVVVVQESSSEEVVEVRLPKKKAPPPQPEESEEDRVYKRAYHKMFTFE